MMVWLIGFIHKMFIWVPAVSYSVLIYEIGITTPLGLFWDENSWNIEALRTVSGAQGALCAYCY